MTSGRFFRISEYAQTFTENVVLESSFSVHADLDVLSLEDGGFDLVQKKWTSMISKVNGRTEISRNLSGLSKLYPVISSAIHLASY